MCPVYQRQDWKKHKLTCKPLSSGKWINVVFNANGRDEPRSKMIGYKGIIVLKLIIEIYDHYPERIPSRMDVIDESYSERYVESKEHNVEIWTAICKAFEPRTQTHTIYRWGRRVSSQEWQICFDLVPQQKLTW